MCDGSRLVIPILSTSEMRAADAAETKIRGTDALVAAAGTAGRRWRPKRCSERVTARGWASSSDRDSMVATVEVAAAWLSSRGAKVDVIEVAHQPGRLEPYTLVIDAAFGLGVARPYVAPAIHEQTLVLAVDLPSGVEALTPATYSAHRCALTSRSRSARLSRGC